MIIKEYTIVVTVAAEYNEAFPSIEGFVGGLNDALPDDWFSPTEGDDYSIEKWHYKEVNNPEWISHNRRRLDK